MLSLLLKKQFTEIFRAYFYDAKKNKARSVGTVIAYFALFFVLMVGVLGGIFAFLSASICAPLCDAGMPWLYFLLMGILSVFLGAFGSVFNTYAGLYLAKDNDLLLSLPIPVKYILFSRLLTVYLLGLLYSGIVLLPASIVYWVVKNARIGSILGCLFLIFSVSVLVLTLSCALGFAVAKISVRLKNKSFTTVFLSLLFITAYYFFYAKAQVFITFLVENAAKYGAIVHSKAYPLYLFGMVGTGDVKASVIVTATVLLLFLLVYFLLAHNFIQTATATGKTVRKAYKRSAVRARSVSQALLLREFRRFAASPTYILNCGIGTLFLPLLGIAVLWKGKQIFPVLKEMFVSVPETVFLLLCVAVCACCSINNTTVPSISLEGNTLPIIRSLPVSSRQILRAKLSLQLILTVIPALFCLLCIFLVCPAPFPFAWLIPLQVLSYILLSAEIGLYIGLKTPILTFTSEVTPIKQSVGVFLDLLFGAVYCVLFGGLFFLIGGIGLFPYMIGVCAVNLILCFLLYRTLCTKGCAMFEAL